MIILGIETSCDETSVSVVSTDIKQNQLSNVKVLSSCTFSQADIHSVFGGVVPEVASRNHMSKILPLYNKAVGDAGINQDDIDLIAVTAAPGLIGALFVGVSFGKGLAYSLNKPIFPVHHLAGHILSAELSNPQLIAPYLAVVVSGGHTHIYEVKDNPLNFSLWGRTIDDAAGEAFDKVAKMLGGPYPGGPFVENLAKSGRQDAIKFPIALKKSNNFSFSGLKTAVLTKIAQKSDTFEDIAASFQHTVSVTLADKALIAAKELRLKKVVVAGGVACNNTLRKTFNDFFVKEGMEVFFPSPSLCNDNAAMIAYAAARMVAGQDLTLYYNLNFAAGDTKHEIDTV